MPRYCQIVFSVFDSSSQTWGAPEDVRPSYYGPIEAYINDAKQVALLHGASESESDSQNFEQQGLLVSPRQYDSWTRNSVYIQRASSTASRFGGIDRFGLASSFAIVTEQDSTHSLSVAQLSEFTNLSNERIFNSLSPLKLLSGQVNQSGDRVMAFYQMVASQQILKVASKKASDSNWVIATISDNELGNWRVFFTDDQKIRLIQVEGSCKHWVIQADRWSQLAMPPNCNFGKAADSSLPASFDRNGNYVSLEGPLGLQRWLSYDAARNKLIQNPISVSETSGNGLLLGYRPTNFNESLVPTVALSGSGHAIALYAINYNLLPLPSGFKGTSSIGVKRPWVFLLR